MVLTGQYQSLHACRHNGSYPLHRIKFLRKEDFWAFLSVAPFPIRKGIHRKMYKCIKFGLLKCNLPLMRHH